MRIQLTQLVQALQTSVEQMYALRHMLINTESCGNMCDDARAYRLLNEETWAFIHTVRVSSGVHLDTNFIKNTEESIYDAYGND